MHTTAVLHQLGSVAGARRAAPVRAPQAPSPVVGGPMSVAQLEELQRTAGNAAVQRLWSPASAPGAASVQRACGCGGGSGGCGCGSKGAGLEEAPTTDQAPIDLEDQPASV